MSENNKGVIKSAFSFSYNDLKLNRENGEDNTVVNVWNIPSGNGLNLSKPQKAIKEEYKTYGTENKKRLVKRTFYKDPSKSEQSEVAYFEIFNYDKDNSIAPSENQISYVYKPNLVGKDIVDNENSFDQVIGYRYYKSPKVNILDDSSKTPTKIDPKEYFTVLNNKQEHKYEIYAENNENHHDMIVEILRNRLENSKDYEICGTDLETIGFLTTMQRNNPNKNVVIKIPDYDDLWKCEITKTADDPEDKKIITYFNSGDTLKILDDETLSKEQKE